MAVKNACVCVCLYACVCACLYACARVCMLVCVCVHAGDVCSMCVCACDLCSMYVKMHMYVWHGQLCDWNHSNYEIV